MNRSFSSFPRASAALCVPFIPTERNPLGEDVMPARHGRCKPINWRLIVLPLWDTG